MSEPTLHPQFLDIINYLKSRNIKIKICTNGDTNNPIFWKKLGEMLNNDDRVWFGICGST
jgi:MoaA/NifB/PqqE/SkfB family radical SAM enzyme